MPNYMTELSPDNNAHVYQIKDKEAAPIDLLKDTVGWSGKNHVIYPYANTTKEVNGLTFTDNKDGTITISGTATADTDFTLFSNDVRFIPKAGMYKATMGINIANVTMVCDAYTLANSWVKNLINLGNGTEEQTVAIDYNGYGFLKGFIRVKNGVDLTTPIIIKPMLRPASIADDTYEPYHPSVEQTLRDAEVIEGKNLLEIQSTTLTRNNLTFTVNSDGTVDVNGTASADTDYNITENIADKLTAETYYMLSGCPSGGASTSYGFGIRYEGYEYGNGKRFKLTSSQLQNKVWVGINIKSGTVCNHLLFKPMLCLASEGTDFEPYYIPLKDSKFDRAEQRVLGAKNRAYKEVEGSLQGSVTEGYTININSNSYSIVAKVSQNTNYIVSKNALGNRFRIILFVNEPSYVTPSTSAKEVVNDASLISAVVNTENYNYIVMTGNYSTAYSGSIEGMIRLASDPDDTYVPYAMTNRELTDMMTPVDITSQVTASVQSAVNVASYKVIKLGKLVQVSVDMATTTPDDTSPGTRIFTGLPAPHSDIYLNLAGRGADTKSARVKIAINGDVNVRYGAAGQYYDMFFTYICK